MMKIEDIIPGNSYACKFKIKTLVDAMGRPAPNLSDVPVAGEKMYEGIGILEARDMDTKLVKLVDEKSSKKFVVPFSDIWDIDTIEWKDPLISNS